MHSTPREKLREIIERYGPEVSLDARRCEAFLRDLCGDFRKEIFVLTSAAREGIPQGLRTTSDMPINALLAFHSKQMHENLGISEDLCGWAVETWAYALGIAAAKDVRAEARCPACDVKIKIQQKHFGRQAKCPKCLSPLMISVAGMPLLRLLPDEPAVFTAPSANEQDFGAILPEIETAKSESAEDVFRQVVSQTIQTAGTFQPEHLPHLDQARSSLGLSYETSRRIISEVAFASLPLSKREATAPAQSFPEGISWGPDDSKHASPPPVASDTGSRVPQFNGPPPIILNPGESIRFVGSTETGSNRETLFIGEDADSDDVFSTDLGGPSAVDIDVVRRKLTGPATGLIATGGLTILIGCFLIGKLSAQDLARSQLETVLTGVPIFISLTMGIVMLLGALKMLKLENYMLAMTAAMIAMAPCYCCVLGFPIGMWAVNVLNEEDVKKVFWQRSHDEG